MRTFGRAYYAWAALTFAAAACLPWLVPLSYRALGFAPDLADAGTYPAFQAHLATLALRRRFLAGLLLLAVGLAGLSLVAIVLRARRRVALPWPLLALTMLGAAGLAVMLLAGLAGGVGACC